ncbi:uncharacterized protein LOC142159449 [Mixophyes fleayi]|uniref:uncharacterized protein LOC142159449 n=1 Tax=Mixophyes fleayi TaxID=3061075 RepID=UPI003F4D9507
MEPKERSVTPAPRGHHYKSYSSVGAQRCSVYCHLSKLVLQTLVILVGVVLVGFATPQNNEEDRGWSNATQIRNSQKSNSTNQLELLVVECKEGKILEPYSNYSFVAGQWYLYGFWRYGYAGDKVRHYTPKENVSANQHDLHTLCLKEYNHYKDIDLVPTKSVRWVSKNPHLPRFKRTPYNITEVLCTKQGVLDPEDTTGGEYDGWYILKATFIGSNAQDSLRVRTYFDRPIPIIGTIKGYCMLRDSQLLITRESKYAQGHVPTDYLQTSVMIMNLNCSNTGQAMWNNNHGPVDMEGLYRAAILKIKTDAKNQKYIRVEGSPSIRSFMITIMRDKCVPEVAGYYFITYAHWEPDKQMVMLDLNPWRWDIVCNGIDTPIIDVWMDGTPMTEEYRNRYVSVDWKDPSGRDINFDINIDGPFKWPFCEVADEGCWTFSQWTYLSKTKPVKYLSLQPGDSDQWYPFKGRGQVCVTVVRIPYETEVLEPVRPHFDDCNIPIHKIADVIAPQLSSPWTIITNVKFMLYTWRISVEDFRVDRWDHRCEELVRNQLDMLKGWVESGQETRKDDWRLKKDRGKRDAIATALGGGAMGIGTLNTMDLEVLRNKLGSLAQHTGDGIRTQLDVNHILENLQHAHIDATTSLSVALREKFRGLVLGLIGEQDRAQLALACTQVQSELSENLKHIVSSLHNGHYPFNLRQRIKQFVPDFALNHTNWWLTQWHGCLNLTCTASSLAPVSGRERKGYTAVNLGIPMPGDTILHPRLQSDTLTYEGSHPYLFDTDGCWRREDAILCQGNHDRVLRQQCWDTEGSCLMDVSPKPSSNLKYLGQGYWCWYQFQNVSYTVYATNCTQRGNLLRGAYCTLIPTLGIDVADEMGRTPVTPEKRLDIRPDTPVRLQKIPLGFGTELKNWLLDFGKEDDILEKLKETEKQATIKLEHDAIKITKVLHALEEDAKVSWW